MARGRTARGRTRGVRTQVPAARPLLQTTDEGEPIRIDGDLVHSEGAVEFRAHYERDGIPGVLHELSRFVRDDDHRWVYVGPLDARLD